MLALTGVELFVILVTAVVQMYCIKNLLDNKVIVWYVHFVTFRIYSFYLYNEKSLNNIIKIQFKMNSTSINSETTPDFNKKQKIFASESIFKILCIIVVLILAFCIPGFL